MSTLQPPTPPQQLASQPEKIDQAKLEYDRLIAYFKLLVWITGALFGIVVAAGAFFFGKSIDDVKAQATGAVRVTQETATLQIAAIGKTAQETAKSAVAAAVDTPSIHAMIEKKVNTEVEAAIQKNLAKRIQDFENEIKEISSATSLINMVEIQAGTPEAGDSLHKLIEMQYSPSPRTRDLVKQNLAQLAKGIAKRYPEPKLGQDRPRDLITRITRNPNAEYPFELWMDFRKMQQLTGWNVEVFDSHAAVKWCDDHKPKCDE